MYNTHVYAAPHRTHIVDYKSLMFILNYEDDLTTHTHHFESLFLQSLRLSLMRERPIVVLSPPNELD